jgi:calcineurin-like phosphoesterase
MPVPFEIATSDVKMSGIVVTVDSSTKKAENIQRILVDAQHEDSARYDSDDGKPEHFNNFS